MQHTSLDRKHLWHPYTRFSAFADKHLPIITRGEGIYLYDMDGNRYIDAISSWWACNLGHGHPRIVDAIKAQSGELQHSILGNLSHPRAIELSAKLAERLPDRDWHALYASDGASAVEAALKIALQYWYNIGRPEKRGFVSLKHAYHGDTLTAVSLGYIDRFHKPFKSILIPVHQAPVPPYDADTETALDGARQLFREQGDHIAAMIVEPLCQGAAGMRIYAPAFLLELFNLCKKHDVLFIADEIAVGLGRTGKWFAFQHLDIAPDIICIGKALSAGYLPISAALVRDPIYTTFDDRLEDHTFYHGHTYAGNPIAAAAALAALAVYDDERIPDQARAKGAALQQWMHPLTERPTVKDVRCLGMIAAVELKEEQEATTSTPRPQRIQRHMTRAGYLVRPLGAVIYLMLPLTTPREIIHTAVEDLGKAIENGV